MEGPTAVYLTGPSFTKMFILSNDERVLAFFNIIQVIFVVLLFTLIILSIFALVKYLRN